MAYVKYDSKTLQRSSLYIAVETR